MCVAIGREHLVSYIVLNELQRSVENDGNCITNCIIDVILLSVLVTSLLNCSIMTAEKFTFQMQYSLHTPLQNDKIA